MKKKLLFIFLIAFIFRATLAFLTWHGDLNNHLDWGERFWQYGPEFFYKSNVWSFTWPNQPPGTILIFALVRKLFEGVFGFFWWINVTLPVFPSNLMLFFEDNLYQALLKLPAILADLGIGYLVYSFFSKRGKAKIGLIASGVFLFNPITWYNSSLWGQTDSIVNFFSFVALFFLVEKKLIKTLVFLTVSLFIKLSLVILVPVFLMIALRQKYPLRIWVKGIILSAILAGIITFPFAQGEPFSWLFGLYREKVLGLQLQLITANAFNFWAAIFGIHAKSDSLIIGFLPVKIWGYILFSLTLIPIFLRLYKRQDVQTILNCSFLTAFSSFVFLTGIHERYLYPVFPILVILALVQKKWLPLLFGLSAIHLVNLYNFWWYPKIDILINLLSFGDRLLPRILGAVVTGLFLWSYFRILLVNKSRK